MCVTFFSFMEYLREWLEFVHLPFPKPFSSFLVSTHVKTSLHHISVRRITGLIKGSTKVLESINSNKPLPAERPKTLKKLKRVYESSNGEGPKNDQKSGNNSSGSERESENKENKERMSALSPFDEQEEWAKIQEIMASFGTGIVRESVFVAELEKEFQSRLMSLSFSQNNINSENICTVEKWLQNLDMIDYLGLFMTNGFDDLDFLVSFCFIRD